MAIGKADRLKQRRHKGPSAHEECRGPNTGAWENTFIPIRRDQGFKTGVSDHRVDASGKNRVNMKGPY